VIPRVTIPYLSIAISLTCLLWPIDASAVSKDSDCLMCHSSRSLQKKSDGRNISLYVDPKVIKASVHSELTCIECHTDLTNESLVHKPNVSPVDCSRCHVRQASHPDAIHSVIDRKKRPSCANCHGTHYVLSKNNQNSNIYPPNSEILCIKCHADAKAVKEYRYGIHGMAKDKSGRAIAGCIECHKVHEGVSATAPRACADCHMDEFLAFSGSVHGRALSQGNTDVPTCVKCHGNHDMLPSEDPRSTTYPTREAKLCGACHDDSKLANKYGLPDDRVETYLESYHGIAVRHGNLKAATCTSCHESHGILVSSDPASSTHKSNLPDTCAKCHINTNERWAEGKSHVVISPRDKNVLYYVSTGFKWLTIGTMTALIGHIMLDLFAHTRRRFRRMTSGGGR